VKAAILVVALTVSAAQAESVTFRSGVEHTPLLELYTSEGCSSCPPAEAWVGRLRQRGDLWKGFVPVVFHVDYWNGLGWPDRFASREYSQRQRGYAAAWGTSTVYTPGFVLDGAEWRAWSRASGVPGGGGRAVGVLEVTLRDRTTAEVSYSPAEKGAPPAEVEIALLGTSIETKVGAGENRGKTLRHEFVVLHRQGEALAGAGGKWRATFKLPATTQVPATALAAWVTRGAAQPPLQAVGGWLAAP